MKSAKSGKDKFETLCHIKADVTGASYTSNRGENGKMAYECRYNLILLVGFTELKAQIAWIDSETVREISFNLHPAHLI